MRARTLLFALALALFFYPCRHVQAEQAEFSGFTMDLSDEWTFATEGETVILVAKDASCAITLTVAPTGGMLLEELASVLAKELQGDSPVRTADEFMFFFPTANGLVSRARLSEEQGAYILAVITGEHPALEAMLASIRPR